MINVLFVSSGFHAGGAERQLINLLKGMDKKCFRPVLVIMSKEGQMIDEVLSLDIQVEFILRRWRWDIFLFRKFIRLIKKEKIQIVHTWGMMPAFYIMLARLFKKFIWINSSIRHTLTELNFRFFLAKLLLYPANYRVANSLAGLTSYGFKPGTKNMVVYNGVIKKELSMNAMNIRAKYNIGEGRVIASSGRLEPEKNFSGFLKIAAVINRSFPDTYFVIMGRGSLEGRLRDEAKLLGIDKRTVFTGFVQNVHDILQITDVFIMLSALNYGEGTSNSIAEAMCHGIPVIGSNSGGNSELIDNEKTGFIISNDYEKEIPVIINELFLDKEFYSRISGNAVESVRNKFSFDVMVNKYQKLYETSLRA